MTSKRRLLIIGGSIAGALLLVLLLLPALLRGRVAALVESEIDGAVRADVSWSSVELSLIRTFPTLGLVLDDVPVVGQDDFAGDTLAAVDRLGVSLELGSVIRAIRGTGPVVVRSVALEGPSVRLLAPAAGRPSWDVFVRDDEPGTSGERQEGDGLAVQLRALRVSDGRLHFRDDEAGLVVDLQGLEHALSGDFSRDSLVAATSTTARAATLVFAGTPYLPGVTLDFDADLAVTPASRRVSFRDNELRLNDLLVRFSGEMARVGEDLDLDLRFDAPSAEFRQILSMVPAVYGQDFESLETEGRFQLTGSVEGRYGPTSFPALDLHVGVEDGAFRYPDLPLPARAIRGDLTLRNPGGELDSTSVRLSGFHVEIGDQPMDVDATLLTPVSDPDVAADVRGTLDLGALSRTVKLADVRELQGVVSLDARGRARRSQLEARAYEDVAAEGRVTARDVRLSSADLRQPLAVDAMELVLSPELASLESLTARLGSSDIDATGRIDNLLGFLAREEPLRGVGRFTSRRVVLDEWRSGNELRAIPVPAMLDLALQGSVDSLQFGAVRMADAVGSMQIRDQRLTLDGFRFETLGGSMAMTGHYETLDVAQPTFAFDLDIDSVDVAGAARTFSAVRALAPVARYAQGTFSSELSLAGALTEDMAPVLNVLDGSGSLLTSRIAVEGFPLLQRLEGLVPVPGLDHPTFNAVRSSIRIEDGRLHVEPFDVSAAGLTMRVAGSNGIDQSLDYGLSMSVPRSLLGGAADGLIQDLASRAGQMGLGFASGETIPVAVAVGGTVQDPSLTLRPGDPVGTARAAAQDAAGAAVEREVEQARAQVDEAAEEARASAAERADSLVADAEERAEAIRAEARRLAEQIRAEGNRGADEVLARATNPLARAAAEPVADRIRREAEDRATQVEEEADERAGALVAEARAQAERIRSGG